LERNKIALVEGLLMRNLVATEDLFSLLPRDRVTRKNFSELIQFSKVQGSKQWAGSGNSVGNTPQRGINWIGDFPISEES